MLVFKNYTIVSFGVNDILIIEEDSNGFKVKNKYKINAIDWTDHFKLYKLGDKGLLIISLKNTAYLLSRDNYE
jgi:hypothetical protein